MTTFQAQPDATGTPLFCLPYIPLGYQQINSLSAATGLAVPAGAIAALIQVEGANVRYRDDGAPPTTTVGMLFGPGGSPLLYAGNLAGISFIQVTAGAVLNVLYYK